MKKINLIMVVGLFLFPLTVFAQSTSDYLILQDIGPYKLEARQKVIGGFIGGPRLFDGAGAIAPTSHFYVDHTDKTYEVYYEGGNSLNSPTVQVTPHVGGDSDRWILHELDAEFRNYYGIPGKSYSPEQIDGWTILEDAVGGYNIRWLSGNKIIEIKYYDSQMTRPEPLEVVRAYLTKYPSTIQPFTLQQLRSDVSTIKWIKDEMERRLWLCDKWNAQFQAGKVTLDELLQALVKSMTVFLNYRQKYFSVSATDDIRALDGYWESNDATSIQSKLRDCKTWWSTNKTKAISL